MTDLKKLKQLVKLMVDNDLVELDIEGESDKVKLKRKIGNDVQFVNAQQAMTQMPAASQMVPAAPASPVSPPAVVAAAEEENLLEIISPMVGSFYTASSPDAKDFISIGDSVTESSVVCIVEAMKVFNEIKAEVKGTVVKRLVENGQAVEFGQPLFLVKPD
ncbi:Acetyl-CoA biotin carboxyl carrier [Poriferisphaera corsica]|uniref:Biotin carboxyl carrier protein of acetyl-CoA carboxylase n=1 Tax=Poriferisphaera corsica TaxID=2528020 RepID=A0A517YVL3_9BACT|nr:acetyl-CoA carboxylase biotin carboxyl carrier protein [Poriferisphaera corsica]QDU34222.1 Acetyl-CoA biotin carboxyl carrier [Poriferisphaera corsica]